MDKKALLAVVLSFIVLYIYQAYFMPLPSPVPPETGQQSSVLQSKEIESVTKEVLLPELDTKTRNVVKKTASVKASENTYDGNIFRAVFSSAAGGGLKSFELKEYRTELDKDSPKVNRIELKEGDDLPLGISFSGSGINISNETIFEVGESSGETLSYIWSSGDGVSIQKRYAFNPDDYRVDVEVKIKNASSRRINGKLGIKLFERYDGPAKDTLDIRRLITNVNSEIDRVDFSDLEKKEDVKKGDISWIALENKYFISAVLTEDGSGLTVRTDMKEDGLVSSALEDEGISLDPGKEDIIKYTFYSGPKDLNIMKGIGKGLEGAIDLGWFHLIAEPLLRFLKFIYSFTGNYGYAVILVTLIIKIIFFPLANKSYKSMKEMQKLQPQMAELREKYKDEKEKMSREIMELYRKNRVNPLSGCLPMIVQIPVFIALYNVLMNAIELRHAPFHFWIVDMSTKDPYYVTPLIMGLTMFLQQKMSPSAPDPTQQKVMMMMPVIFTFMFMNLPSGLVLYWVVNNILSIGQQYYILKKA